MELSIVTASFHFEKRLAKFSHSLNPQETLLRDHSGDSRAKSELAESMFHETTAR
jgi:hypothetical protein